MKAIVCEGVVPTRARSNDVSMLHRLLYFAIEGRHIVLFESASELEDWLNTLDTPTSQAYRQAVNISSRLSTTLTQDTATVRIAEIEQEHWETPTSTLTIANAINLLAEPLGIVLENAKNDWNFLIGIMRKSERDIVQKAFERRWLEAVHGGGSDIKQLLADRKTNPSTRLRTFSMFDSDRRHPDELAPNWEPINQEACQGYINEISAQSAAIGGYWRLTRRFIESYIPRHELEKVNGVPQGAIDAYFRLSRHGRWYFNMKKGFKGDEPAENAHRAKNLYSAVSQEDRAVLKNGFGRKLADRYQLSGTEEFAWDSDALHEATTELPKLMRLL